MYICTCTCVQYRLSLVYIKLKWNLIDELSTTRLYIICVQLLGVSTCVLELCVMGIFKGDNRFNSVVSRNFF